MKKTAPVVATLGRNMLCVTKFKKFLDGLKAKQGAGVHSGLSAIYERYMKGSVSIEVKVHGVLGVDYAECRMRARGEITEVFFAPLDCLTPVKPVVVKSAPPVNLFRELDRLIAFA